jgi:hypothetical protein
VRVLADEYNDLEMCGRFSRNGRGLLLLDGAVNLVLGIALLFFPGWLVRVLGAPAFSTRFYAAILGGVLVGIGLALFLESRRRGRAPVGLGLAGAIIINVCGAGALVAWLLLGQTPISGGGRVILWAIAVVVLGIAAAEIATGGLAAPADDEV